jgi:hypothetical protein
MYFVEMSEQDLSEGMIAGYWVQAWTAFVCYYVYHTVVIIDI